MSYKVALDWMTPTVLFASAGITYVHGEYGSAFVCAACAGFCLGLVCGRYFVNRW